MLDMHPKAMKLFLAKGNHNTHFHKSITETFGEEEGKGMLSRIELHHTTKHASWLNIAEIEFNPMDTKCTNRRFKSRNKMETKVAAWTRRKNHNRTMISWKFDREKADKKLSKYYI
ncbi:MAG: transposase [Thermoplasmatales archaeon]